MERCSCAKTERTSFLFGAVLFGLLATATGCPTSQLSLSRDSAQLAGSGTPVTFQYLLPEGGALQSQSLLGRDTVLLFVTTYDNLSLAEARRLVELSRDRTPRINAVLVVLEPPLNAPLVSVFRDSLSSDVKAVLADSETMEGRGALGDMRQVPGVVLLDRDGRLVARGFGAEAYRAVEERLRSTADVP